jgi:hypothetical protein
MAAGVLEQTQAANPAGDPEAEMQELYALSSESYELASYTCFVTICTIHLACCE